MLHFEAVIGAKAMGDLERRVELAYQDRLVVLDLDVEQVVVIFHFY